jgi:hypothetical protein
VLSLGVELLAVEISELDGVGHCRELHFEPRLDCALGGVREYGPSVR